MGTLSQLLRWKRELTLKGPDEKDLRTVWLRIIGDHDLQEAYRLARVASAEKRKRLRDVDSIDFKDQIESFKDADEETCRSLIRASRENAWTSQALSTVVRPDEVKISEVAVDPDAPILEEQEKLDAENLKIEEEYQQALQDFVAQKRKEMDAELEKLSLADLQVLSQAEAIVLLPLTVFMNELIEQKTWRAVYEDKELTVQGFDSIEDFRAMVESLRQQLIQAYAELEENAGDIKN